MDLETAKKDMIAKGLNPNDFNINIKEEMYSATPRRSYVAREVAKNEDKPIKSDVDEVAITSAFILEDSMTTAEMVGMALLEIEELKAEIASLKEDK